jgi:hypothetical protein
LLAGDGDAIAIVCHPFSSPNGQLQVQTTSQYFAAIFNPYIGTMSILFRPHMQAFRSIFFNETFRISYYELAKHVGQLRITFSPVPPLSLAGIFV